MLNESGFEEWAGNYDDSIRASSKEFPFDGYYNVLAAVVSLVEPKPQMKVMDVGIGTGLLSEELKHEGCFIYGVDFSVEMIEKAKLRIPGAFFEAADVSKDHFGRFNLDQFDRIISTYFFHHLNPEQKVSFIKRSLKDNLCDEGRIIIADIGFENEDDFRAAYERHRTLWDKDEFYLCGHSIVLHLQSEGIVAEYQQISSCAGILVCSV